MTTFVNLLGRLLDHLGVIADNQLMELCILAGVKIFLYNVSDYMSFFMRRTSTGGVFVLLTVIKLPHTALSDIH